MVDNFSLYIFLYLTFNLPAIAKDIIADKTVVNNITVDVLTTKSFSTEEQVQDLPMAKETAKFSSDLWPGFTDTNGNGLYWDIIRKVYEDNNIEVVFETTNYTRSKALVKNNIFHAYIGAYLHEEKFALYPKYPIDVDYISACTAVDSKETISIENIVKFSVIWIKGYSYEKIFDHQFNYQEITNRQTGFKLIANHRINYYIDADSDIKSYLENNPTLASKIKCKIIHHESIYLAFNKAPYAMHLKTIWDNTIPTLIQSGFLEKTYKEYSLKSLPQIFKK
jgi:polar amino acid transport system substrate-binding protein